MGYEKVEETVLKEAEAAAAGILAEAKKRQEEDLARLGAECEKERREALAEARARSERETARQVSRARHAGRMQVLDAKNKIIDAVFRQAAEALGNLPEQQYLELMRSWLDALPPDCSGVLRVNPSDVAGFTESFLRSINDKRGPMGFITGVVADPGVHGGFVIEAEDSRAEQTIDRKIRDLREEMSSELARELFRE